MQTDKIKITKKAYTTPRFIVHGSVEQITQGWFGPRQDFFTGNDGGFAACQGHFREKNCPSS